MPLTSLPPVRGLVLAAGAGRRMGGPKALLPAPTGGTLVSAAVRVLVDGGCDGVTVVVGAQASAVRDLALAIPDSGGIDVVDCPDWAEGMGASLRAGLSDIRNRPGHGIEAVLVTLVDLPDVTAEVARRLLAPAATLSLDAGFEERTVRGWRASLRRATYGGVPGHPALIGRDFWDETIATAVGDRGAREVFRSHPHELVECGDLATGRDVDTREQAAGWGLPFTKRRGEQ